MKDLDLQKVILPNVARAHMKLSNVSFHSPKRRLKMLQSLGNSIAFIQLNVKGNNSLASFSSFVYKVLKVGFLWGGKKRVRSKSWGEPEARSRVLWTSINCQFSAQNYKNTFFKNEPDEECFASLYFLFSWCLRKFQNHLQMEPVRVGLASCC